MKKLLLTVAVLVLCMSVTAQQYIIVDNELPIQASDVDKITYEQDEQCAMLFCPCSYCHCQQHQ